MTEHHQHHRQPEPPTRPATTALRHPILEDVGEGPHARVVDELVIHAAPIDFETLCDGVVTPSTRYIVFDLDRTVHQGRNLGELLGFELVALASYGAEHLAAVDERRAPGRTIFEARRPAATASYLARGMRLWAYPGLLYLFGVKLGSRSERVRPWLYRLFGSDPIEALQDVPRTAMMHHLAEVPIEVARTLARRTWRRHAADQVVCPEHVAWLRRRCPNARILLSSASPLPVVEQAARALGVDDWFCTEVEQRDGYLSSPFVLDRRFLLGRLPRRLSPPSLSRVNAGASKIARLCERFPDFMEPDVETLGISDNSYGEDGAWTEHFTRVIDINSPNPFAPIVSRSSPLCAIHSARVFTRDELEAQGDTTRTAGATPKRWSADELAAELANIVEGVEAIAADYRRRATTLEADRSASETRLDEWLSQIEHGVTRYNEAAGAERLLATRRLRRDLRGYRRASRRKARKLQPLSALTYQLEELLATARCRLD